MLPEELKQLIEKYCQGLTPTPNQENEINEKVFELGADPMEVFDYIEKVKMMKSKAELEAEEIERRSRQEEARQRAETEAQLAARAVARAEEARAAAEEAKAKTASEIHRHEVKKERKRTFVIITVAAVVVISFFIGYVLHMRNMTVKEVVNNAIYYSIPTTNIRDVDVDTSVIPNDDPSVVIDHKKDVMEQLRQYYSQVYDYSDGFYKIKKDNLLGIADKQGKIIQKPKYDQIFARNSKGLIKVTRGKYYGYLNIQGVEVIPPVYSSIDEEVAGLIKVEIDKKYGFLNGKTLQVVTPCRYDYIYSLKENRYKVKIGGKIGYLKADGTVDQEPK